MSRAPTPSEYSARRRAERQRQAGVLGIALALSVLVHLVLFRTVDFELRLQPRPVLVPPPEAVDVAPVMKAYDIVTVDVEVPPIEVQIQERQILREAQRVEITAPAAEVATIRPPTEREPTSVRDRLRYRMGSQPDVWTPPRPAAPGELAPDIEMVERRVASSIQEYNDSVAGAKAAAEKALDWTTTDAQGRRWGVSPGQIHVAGVSLPMPFSFAPAPGRRDEVAGRIRNWSEIQQQVAREEGRDIIEDRIRAMRERADRERRARMAADTTGG